MTSQESFEMWVSQFDTTGDKYLDMGSDEYFTAGYDSRQPEIEALKAENEKLRNITSINMDALLSAHYGGECPNPKYLAAYEMSLAAMTAPDTKGE